MKFEMPELTYAVDALEPHISAETINYHYGKHTQKYYATASELIKGTVFEKKVTKIEDLLTKEVLLKAESALFNNAAQAWNHTFYFEGLNSRGEPSEALIKEVDRMFDDFKSMQEEFNAKAMAHLGSGWMWLVVRNGNLSIKLTPNCATVLTEPNTDPLLVCDIWEHSWYLQYPADKNAYLKAFWKSVNWTVVNERYEAAIKKLS